MLYKTKWYLAERTGSHWTLRLELGAFRTETAAYNSMMQPSKEQDPERPSAILMERKPEFRDRRITTVKGKRALEFPHIYQVQRAPVVHTEVVNISNTDENADWIKNLSR